MAEQTRTEELKVSGAALKGKLKEIIRQGNVRRIVVRNPDGRTILDVIETTSRGFLLTGRKLLALVQSDDPRIAFERVGARPVNWNPQEWLPSDRGVKGAPKE